MTISVNVRQVTSPEETAGCDTDGLRDKFLIAGLFVGGEINLTYSHLDRMIVGGIVPADTALVLDAVGETGTETLLERREAMVINVGGEGHVRVGGQSHALGLRDGLYVGMGAGALEFGSADPADPARFYLVSAPAHRTCPTQLITLDMAKKVVAGSPEQANARTINQYVHPEICESCQLLVGVTLFEPGSVWNTMPAHVHDRRMEVYLYFGMEPDTRVFHFMGKPDQTRHLVIKNLEAVLSPGWSIHSGAGTGRYAFIWAMAGDNMSFTDMDMVPMEALR